MICPNCDEEIEEGSKFCTRCGADLSGKKEISKVEGKEIELKGRMIGSPILLEKEKILGEFKASFWDLGLIGFLLRYKDRIIVTTHRVFYFSKRIFGEFLKCLYLRKVESLEVGSILKLWHFLIGVILLLYGIFGGHGHGMGGMRFGGIPWYLRLVIILIAVAFILTAKKKVLSVSTGDTKNSISFPFRRMKKAETKRFVDLTSKAIEDLEGK